MQQKIAFLAILFAFASSVPARAQDVSTVDGKTYLGQVALDGGQVVVHSEGGENRFDAAAIDQARFASATRPAALHGLKGEYFDAPDLKKLVLTRLDDRLWWHWEGRVPAPNVPPQFSVRWTGFITAPYSETYNIALGHFDGARLWIGDKLLIDHWTPGGAEDRATIALTGGKPVPIRVELFCETQRGAIEMRWSSPSLPYEGVGPLRLTPPDDYTQPAPATEPADLTHGLLGHYYFQHSFEALLFSRVDRQINFDWNAMPDPVLHRQFTVRWLGTLTPERTDAYSFDCERGGMAMVKVDGKPVYKKSLVQWEDFRPPITLQAGKPVSIEVVYLTYNINGSLAEPQMRLLWGTPRLPKEVIPSRCLAPASEDDFQALTRGHGLRGEYFTDAFKTRIALRRDANIDFDGPRDFSRWTEGPWPDKFFSRWTGFLTAPGSGKYWLYVSADRQTRLTLDGKMVIDNWKNTNGLAQAEFPFEAGRKYAFTFEFNNGISHGGDAVAHLMWSGNNLPKAAIDPSYFSPPPGDPAQMPQVKLEIPDKPFFLPTDVIPVKASPCLDAADHVKHLDILADGAVIGSPDQPHYIFEWKNPLPGVHGIAARLTDDVDYTPLPAPLPLYVAEAVPGPADGDGVAWAHMRIADKSEGDSFKANKSDDEVRTSGGDLWSGRDACHFTFRPWDGDGRLTVHISALTAGKEGVLPVVGLMLREDLSPASRHVSLILSGEGEALGPGLLRRDPYNAETVPSGSAAKVTLPLWLRLDRIGTHISAFTSTDGVHWAMAGEMEMRLREKLLAGVVVAARGDASASATAVFDHPSIAKHSTAYSFGVPGLLTSNGSFLAGELRRGDTQSVRLYFRGKDIDMKTGELARLLFKPLAAEIDGQIPPRHPGIVLAPGDFSEGEFVSFDGGNVNVTSTLFGPQSFDTQSAAIGIILRDDIPMPGYQIETVDGSIFQTPALKIEAGKVQIADLPCGPISLDASEIVSIKRVK